MISASILTLEYPKEELLAGVSKAYCKNERGPKYEILRRSNAHPLPHHDVNPLSLSLTPSYFPQGPAHCASSTWVDSRSAATHQRHRYLNYC